MRNVITLVLGGGRGTRLYPLTKYRAKPAAPLAGNYRLIDIPLSNCINSGLTRIYVLTQFLSVSLHRHIRQTYRFDMFSGGFVEILAAQQTMEEQTDWYQGTADAVRKQQQYIMQPGMEHVLILSGDQLYRMNYADMFATHHKSGADVTIAGIPVSREAARSLGLMRLDDSGRVVGFVEKPQTPEETEPVRMDPAWFEQHGIASRGRDCIANMGIYLFNRETLADILSTTKFQDFGKEIFPKLVGRYRIQTHLFDGYWEDIGTIRAFYEANLSLAQRNPPFELVLPEAPIYTRPRFLPPTRLNNASVTNCLVADGCQIGEAVVIENSIIGLRCMIGDNVTIRNSVLMGADEFETATPQGRPPMGIGSGSVIEGAIVDKNARIGRNVRINNQRGIEDSEDANDCMIRDGIPIVIKDSTLSDGWTLSEQSMTDRCQSSRSLLFK